MDKVCDMDLPTHVVQQFNLCRLFKQVHCYTDLLDSKQNRLLYNITKPMSTFNKLENFPVIDIPQSYWKHWSAIINTLHSSMKVSGFYAGKIIDKHMMRFLQSNDRKFLLFRTKSHQYYVFNLTSSARNKYVYSREYLSATIRYELCGFQGVQAQVQEHTIVADGFADRPNLLFQLIKPATRNLSHLFAKQRASKIISHLKQPAALPKYMEVPPSQNDQILDMYRKLAQLNPMLQKNLGRITKIEGISHFLRNLENNQCLTVSDASIGSRDRSAHAYIVATLCRKAQIVGVGPVVESTRAELYGTIAVHTLIM